MTHLHRVLEIASVQWCNNRGDSERCGSQHPAACVTKLLLLLRQRPRGHSVATQTSTVDHKPACRRATTSHRSSPPAEPAISNPFLQAIHVVKTGLKAPVTFSATAAVQRCCGSAALFFSAVPQCYCSVIQSAAVNRAATTAKPQAAATIGCPYC